MILHRVKSNRVKSERLWNINDTGDLELACITMIGSSLTKAQKAERLGEYSERLLNGEKIRAKNHDYWISNKETNA